MPVFRYVSPGDWSEDLGQAAVRLGRIPGFTTSAELGDVGMSQVVIDNPDGTVGHASDQITGLKLFTVDEYAETFGNQRAYTGYVAERTYRRRVEQDSSLLVGPANEIPVSLNDLNCILSFRIITAGSRPSETITARLAWLMASEYLSGLVFDNGFVGASSIVMDACDYTGQKPVDVLTDLAIASGFNFFVYFDEVAGQASLWFADSNTSSAWDSGITISNELADIDQAAIANGTATVFYPFRDAFLTRNPARVYSGVYLPYAKGYVYATEPATAAAFASRDGSAPNSNVKTAAAATAIAERFLVDAATEDDRITVTIQPMAAQVNAVLAGQIVTVKFSHLPGYATPTAMRVMKRTVAQTAEVNDRYQVTLDLSPADPEVLVPTHARLMRPNDLDWSGGGDLDIQIWWDYDGDNPRGGDAPDPKYGLVDYFPIGSKPADGWQGLEVQGTGELDMQYAADGSFVCDGDITVTAPIQVNGVTVGSHVYASSGGLRFDGPNFDFTITDIPVVPGDVVTARMVGTGNIVGGITVPAGTGSGSHCLLINGTLVA